MGKCLLFVATLFSLVAFSQARQCYLLLTGSLCAYECCGEYSDMKCLDSCVGIKCSWDDDCGSGGYCSNGKCKKDTGERPYFPCPGNCTEECCDTTSGVCQDYSGCYSLMSTCSRSYECASFCCHGGRCRGGEVCEMNPRTDDNLGGSNTVGTGGTMKPIVVHNEYHEESGSSTPWKSISAVVTTIAVIGIVATVVIVWAVGRSRRQAIVVRQAQVLSVSNGHSNYTSDAMLIVSQDEEQFKYEQQHPAITVSA